MERQDGRTGRRTPGFTLVELLIVLAVLGVLLAIGFAAPKRDRVAVNQAAERISRDLQAVRLEAVRRNEFVGFTTDVADNSYQVYVDLNRNGVFDTGIDTVIRQATFGDQGVRLSDAAVAVRYDPRGLNPSPFVGELAIVVGNPTGDYFRTVCFTTQGATRAVSAASCN